jgi:hypothetical protein
VIVLTADFAPLQYSEAASLSSFTRPPASAGGIVFGKLGHGFRSFLSIDSWNRSSVLRGPVAL